MNKNETKIKHIPDMESLRHDIKSDSNGKFCLPFYGYKLNGVLCNCGTMDTTVIVLYNVVSPKGVIYIPYLTDSDTEFDEDLLRVDIHSLRVNGKFNQQCENIKFMELQTLFELIMKIQLQSFSEQSIDMEKIKKQIESDKIYTGNRNHLFSITFNKYTLHGRGSVINLITSPDKLDIIPILSTTRETGQDGIYFYIHCDRVSPQLSIQPWQSSYIHLFKWLNTNPIFIECDDYQSSKTTMPKLSDTIVKYIKKLEVSHNKDIKNLAQVNKDLTDLANKKSDLEVERERLDDSVSNMDDILGELKTLANL